MDPLLAGLLSGVASLGGSFLNSQAAQANNAANIAYQQLFAQNGIQWRVADAKAAGINPLAALGAQTSSFSNVTGDTSMGTGVSAMGQDISRAINAMQSPEQKALAARKTLADVEGTELNNDIKRQELASAVAKNTQAGQPPGVPPVEGPSVKWEPEKVTIPSTGNSGIEPREVTESRWVRNSSGGLYLAGSKNFEESTSNDTLSNMHLFLRNRLLPQWAGGSGPPKAPEYSLPPGYKWFYSPTELAWYMVPKDSIRGSGYLPSQPVAPMY